MNVQEWGCFSNFLRSDDVTWTMSKGGGVLVKNPVSAPGPPPFKNPGSAPAGGQCTTGNGVSAIRSESGECRSLSHSVWFGSYVCTRPQSVADPSGGVILKTYAECA